MKRDLYKEVTDTIIAALESGTPPWVKPWGNQGATGLPVNAATGREYSGVNPLLLWARGLTEGYSTDRWLTFKQAQRVGGTVNKGAKGQMVVFFRPLTFTTTADDGSEETRSFPMIKHFTVFNTDQCTGLPDRCLGESPDTPELSEAERIEGAEQFFSAVGADVRDGRGKAFYKPSQDWIGMPTFGSFVDPARYYATLAHEHTHWTGSESRLKRDLSGRFGSSSYAMEELVAELGAAYLCADLGIEAVDRSSMADHASYLDSWLAVLKKDSRAIFTAASAAKKAHAYLVELSQSAPALGKGVAA